jgi:hypothetical protein
MKKRIQTMNRNKLLTFATAALLTMGGASMLTAATYAQPPKAVVAQASAPATDCSQDTPDDKEVADGPDTDKVDLQCGDQNAPDGAEQGKVEDTNKGPDADNAQQGSTHQAKQGQPAQASADGEEADNGSDTDNIQSGGGDQVEDGQPDHAGGDGENANQ